MEFQEIWRGSEEPEDQPGRIRVAVLGGDPVVGRAIEALLEDAGYDAYYLDGTSADRHLAEAGVRLLLLAPGAESPSVPAGLRIPVLRLVTDGTASREDSAFWPCRIPDLKRKIEALCAREEPGASEL